MKTQKLTDKYAAQMRGYIPATPGWYLRQKDNQENNVYFPIMAWRDCFGDGMLKEGVLVPVLPCSVVGKTLTEVDGDIIYMPDRFLHPNGDGTFKEI